MARPIKEGADYFSHDVDASADPKLEALEAVYGNDGYAVYFKLLEKIYRSSEFCIDLKLPNIYIILSKRCNLAEKRFREILDFAFELNLYSRDERDLNQVITSSGVRKRAGKITEEREKKRRFFLEKQREKQEEKSREKQGEKRSEENGKTAGETPQSKEKESKEKKSNIYNNPLTPLKGGTDSQPKTEAKPDWNTTLLQIFQEEFQASRGFPYPLTTYKGKEAKEINDVYQKYLQMKASMGVVPNTQQALEEMRTFIKIGMRINDKWIFDNMSPGVLSMKFSTIATMMKENRNGSYQRPNITDADINEIADLTGLR